MVFSDFDAVPSRSSLPSRVALAFAQATVDCQIRPQLVSPEFALQKPVDPDYNVDKLVQKCQAAWDVLIRNPFPQALAKGTAPLNGFRHYMIQDATYLEYYYRVRMESVSRTGSFQDITEFAAKISSSLQYVTSARSDCTKILGVPEGDVAKEPKSQALHNSIDLYKSVVETGNWLDIHIVLLPCIKGYYDIASALLSDPATIRNTVYFPSWIQANSGGSSFEKYKDFINSSIYTFFKTLSDDKKRENWDRWAELFTKACGTETGFFNLGISGFSPYEIVNNYNRVFKIRRYQKDKPYLAVDGSSVVTQAADPGASGIWVLRNTVNGYIVQNGDKYLKAAVGGSFQPTYEVSVSTTEQPWSINVLGTDGSQQIFQLLFPGNLQLVLDAGSNVVEPPSKAFVANNSQISSQLWLLEPAWVAGSQVPGVESEVNQS